MNDGQLNRLPSQRTFVAGRICLSICASCIHPLRLALGLCRMELLSHSKCAFVRCLILIGMEKARLYEPAIPRATSEPFSRNRPSFRPPSVNSKRTAKGFKVGFCLGPTQVEVVNTVSRQAFTAHQRHGGRFGLRYRRTDNLLCIFWSPA